VVRKIGCLPGNGGRTALRLSTGAMERYGFLGSTAEMNGQLILGAWLPGGNMVKDGPEFQNQAHV
jgi:hypothetical protein